jgi:hypothetical protein
VWAGDMVGAPCEAGMTERGANWRDMDKMKLVYTLGSRWLDKVWVERSIHEPCIVYFIQLLQK